MDYDDALNLTKLWLEENLEIYDLRVNGEDGEIRFFTHPSINEDNYDSFDFDYRPDVCFAVYHPGERLRWGGDKWGYSKEWHVIAGFSPVICVDLFKSDLCNPRFFEEFKEWFFEATKTVNAHIDSKLKEPIPVPL